MKEIKLAVFDMAGTTINEDNVVYKTVQQVITAAGYPVSLELVLQLAAGKEKRNAIAHILGAVHGEGVTNDLVDRIFLDFRKALEEAYDQLEVTSFAGVPELFRILRDKSIHVVLNTGYDRRTAQLLIGKLGWQEGREFDALITADDVSKGRPAPDMILLAMRLFGVSDAESVLKAGDSVIDIEEGKNAGCGLIIGVLSGAQTREQLQQAEPDHILENLAGLSRLI